jgi:hypothetical protein
MRAFISSFVTARPSLDVTLGLTHGGEKCNFIGGVTVIDVIWKPVDRLENLFFNAHKLQ